MNRQPVPLVFTEERTQSIFWRNGAPAISRTLWAWARLAGGAAILVVLITRLGAEPFLDAIRLTSAWSLAIAVGITALTTVCCAWRWSMVATTLGVDVRLRPAIAAYYRSQFLNVTLPSGVLGDVERAVRHGRYVGEMGRSFRSVAWERGLGQAVQIGLTVAVLLVLPSPFRSTVLVFAGVVVGVCVVAGLIVVLLAKSGSFRTPQLPARIARAVADDLRKILLVRRVWGSIVLASGVAVAGHVAVFIVAMMTTGTTVSAGQTLSLALIVLLASSVPTNIAGWGPREGAAAWAFSSIGLSAAQGVTVAVVYGVMVLVATLPGAAMLFAGWHHQGRQDVGATRRPAHQLEGVARG